MREHRREMTQSGSDEVQVTFYDASSCFSEEEWALLQEWQKDLYRNVMKEIHQALISLGPLIATTVSTLRAKEKPEPCPMDTEDSKTDCSIQDSPICLNHGTKVKKAPPEVKPSTRTPDGFKLAQSGNITTKPEVSFSKNGGEVRHLNYLPDAEARRGKSCRRAGSPSASGNVCSRTEEQNVILLDPLASEIEEKSTKPNAAFPVVTAVFSLSINDEGKKRAKEMTGGRPTEVCSRREEKATMSSMGRPGAEGGEGSTVTSPDIVPVLIKEEDEVYSMDHQDSERKEDASTQVGVWKAAREPRLGQEMTVATATQITGARETGNWKVPGRPKLVPEMSPTALMNAPVTQEAGEKSRGRPRKVGELLNASRALHARKTFFGESNSKVTQNTEKERMSRNQNWSIRRDNNTAQSESTYINPANFSSANLYPGTSNIGILDKSSEGESTIQNSQFPNYLSNPQLNQTSYTFDHSSSLNRELTGPSGQHSRERMYACTECKRRFFEKSHLITHYKIHSGEKIYPCTFCHKSFNRKYNLDGHIRIHTGERPYKCAECEKDFSRKSDYNRHQKKHTGS